jgi:hypothetical protein
MFKKFLILCIAMSFLSGCTVLEVADMIFDDDCLYRGTVSKVVHWVDTTTVTFETGRSITCYKAEWIEVGDWIEARETDNIRKSVLEVTCDFDN